MEERGPDWYVKERRGLARYGSRGKESLGAEWNVAARMVTAAMLCSGMQRRVLVRRAWKGKSRTGIG